MPHENGFCMVKNSYTKDTYYSICDNYDVNADEIRKNGDWLYMVEYGHFDDGEKAMHRSPPGNVT